jgi:hypothetical protein
MDQRELATSTTTNSRVRSNARGFKRRNMGFVDAIAAKHAVPKNNLVVQYLVRKTRASERGSKARRSLGNLYALLVLSEDYVNGVTSRSTDLHARMRALPFGSKLQNHPLDNRLNDEFSRQLGVNGS